MTAVFESKPETIIINKDKQIGKKIKQAFIITILFIVFVHSFTVIDTINFIIRQKQFEFINEQTSLPNTKGIIVSSVIIFFIILVLLTSSQ